MVSKIILFAISTLYFWLSFRGRSSDIVMLASGNFSSIASRAKKSLCWKVSCEQV